MVRCAIVVTAVSVVPGGKGFLLLKTVCLRRIKL
jgi:hypothetical protein